MLPDFDRRYPIDQLTEHPNLIHLGTWADERYSSCCGNAQSVAEMVAVALSEYQGERPAVVLLQGVFRYTAPVPAVCGWLQQRTDAWKTDEQQLSVAVHIRLW